MDIADKDGIWFAVINVYAASKKAEGSWRKAKARMQSMNVAFHGCRTGKAGNATEIAFDACMSGYRRLVAVGGDGTVHDVLNGIAGFIEWERGNGRNASFSDFTLGVIPVGSGNDWIKTTGVPKDVCKAVDVLASGVVKPQDVVKVTTLDLGSLPEEKPMSVSYMANIGGIGIDARVCTMVNALKRQGKRGRILYVTSLLYVISHRIPVSAKVICDGQTVFDGAFLSMAFGVGRYSGGGMRQTPDAVMDDGLLDVTVIPDLPLGRIAREIPRLFTGTFNKVPELTVARARNVMVIPDDMSCAEPVEVDGEVTGKTPVKFEVLESQINVIVGK